MAGGNAEAGEWPWSISEVSRDVSRDVLEAVLEGIGESKLPRLRILSRKAGATGRWKENWDCGVAGRRREGGDVI